jgi:2-dehydropantoate 2-reductase
VRTLIVGAGATGGYLGAALLAAGRDVAFLVRPAARERLQRFRLRICTPDGSTQTTHVTALTASELHDTFDVILIAVRVAAVPAALDDIATAVGDSTAIIPVVNGTSHLTAMVGRYGTHRVYGGVATLAVSSGSDGIIHAIGTGAALEIGALDRAQSAATADIATYLDVDGLSATTTDDIITAMCAKFGFITSMTILTCLLRSTIGPIARTPGGREVAATALREVTETVAASGHPLPDIVQAGLHDKLTDATSTFGPSMYRDLTSGRPVETDVLAELVDHARNHQLDTPLLDTALVALMLHNSSLNK